MQAIRRNFDFFGRTMLDNPFSGFGDINILWLIPLISGLTALASSLISMRFTKMATSGEQQPGQGCSNVMLLVLMPAFSLFITFTVPGGVGIYWICSNVIAVAQTILLNQIYNPAKIRAQAEKEYEERRRQEGRGQKAAQGSAYPRGGRSPPPSQGGGRGRRAGPAGGLQQKTGPSDEKSQQTEEEGRGGRDEA